MDSNGYCQQVGSVSMVAKFFDVGLQENQQCPPPSNPAYELPVYPYPDNPDTMMCAKPFEGECPAGYHTKKVSEQLGSDTCLPNECPAAGTSEDLYSSTSTGGDPFIVLTNGAESVKRTGLYCNNGCAYDVADESSIYHASQATGVSLGSACGEAPYEDGFLSDSDTQNQCTTTTDANGVSLISCPPPSGNDGNEPDNTEIDNDPNKKDTSDPVPEEPCTGENCDSQNIVNAIKDQTKELIQNDNDNHNLMIDTVTNNAEHTIDAINDVTQAVNLTTDAVRDLQDSTELIGDTQTGLLGQIADGVEGVNSTLNTQVEPDDCIGSLCDFDPEAKFDEKMSEIQEMFETTDEIPSDITTYFSRYTDFITSNFSGFTGTCTPFTLDVSVANQPKEIVVGQHCEPYENYIKPILQWVIWVITALALFNISSQTFRALAYT